MSRYYSKTQGAIPKKMYINQGRHSIVGPYFSKAACDADYKRIEFSLDEDTGNYIRITPLVKEIKGSKKKLEI